MNDCTGDDLINTLNSLNIEFRNISPNVINAWFDTDCKDTKQLLNWICSSLSDVNYISPLERAEYDEIDHLDSGKCLEELGKLNPSYLSILDKDKNLEEILLIKDEIDFLEEENETLDKLLDVYEKLDNNYSLDLTLKTRKEINSKVECKNAQEICEDLSNKLDKTNILLQKQLIKYDSEAHFVNFVNVKDYLETIDSLNSFLSPLMEMEKTSLEHQDDMLSEALETCKKRILHSHQIFLANKVEIEKMKEILEFLNNTNIHESLAVFSNNQMTLEAKEVYKKRMCETLDEISIKLADHYLKQTRIRYVKKELENCQQKSQNISKILDNVTQVLALFTLTNCLQFEEKKDVNSVNAFFQKMVKYINEDLHKCQRRTSLMRNVITEYKEYLSKPEHERSKLTTSIAKVLSSKDYTLESILEAVGKFKTELRFLESQLFDVDVPNEKIKTLKINENIKILKDFLISGPTNRVVIVPIELQNVWFEIEEHLKKESLSVGQAVQIPQNARKALTPSQNFARQLWMSFLTNPSKLDTILKQAEEDFNRRTRHYF